jgi:prepilin-type N-terminal cleavage/methylation domain-containing protein
MRLPLTIRSAGFTLVEMLVSLGVLAFFLTFSIPFLLGTRDQNYLQTNTDQAITIFQMARQYSLAAKPGLDPIKVVVTAGDPPTIDYYPGNDPHRPFTLYSGIEIDPPDTTVQFNKLYGTISSPPPTITLKYRGYKTTIDLEASGDISATKPAKI